MEHLIKHLKKTKLEGLEVHFWLVDEVTWPRVGCCGEIPDHSTVRRLAGNSLFFVVFDFYHLRDFLKIKDGGC